MIDPSNYCTIDTTINMHKLMKCAYLYMAKFSNKNLKDFNK